MDEANKTLARVICVAIFLFAVVAGAPSGFALQVAQAPLETIESESDAPVLEADPFAEFEEFETGKGEGGVSVFDPLSGYNRLMTRVNDKFYFWVLEPVATGYAKITPEFARRSVNRFFTHLGYPVRLVNNLLQLKFERAGVETARFVANTTIGLAGLRDPAGQWMGMELYDEDFGQTLGYYGLGGGFHIVLPFMGPSNLRDAVAKFPDGFLDPINYIEPTELAVGINVYNRINYTSLHLGEYVQLKKDAVDWYIFIRNAYEQNRAKRIKE